MARAKHQLTRRREAVSRLDRLMLYPHQVLLIHYSCESFYDRTDGRSPRVTSIAVRNLERSQTTSFSIHQVAERSGVTPPDIAREYDRLERLMLDEFYEFVRRHENFQWLHWNMRDVNYGFAAIDHRCKVLGGTPVAIPEEQRTDMAALLIDLFGPNYAQHPRLTNVLALNSISSQNFLSGAEEAAAFEAGEYVKLHQSTLRKVDLFVNILNRTWDGTLKTGARWRERYGTTAGGVIEGVTDHWLYKFLGFVGIAASLLSLLK